MCANLTANAALLVTGRQVITRSCQLRLDDLAGAACYPEPAVSAAAKYSWTNRCRWLGAHLDQVDESRIVV